MVDLFRTIDRSGDNVCDLDEMCTMMKSVGLDLSREAVKVGRQLESHGRVYTLDATFPKALTFIH